MNTSRFVSGSSLILAGWLGATFLNDVPAQRYPKLDKKPTAALAPQHPGSFLSSTVAAPVAPAVSVAR